MSFQLFTIPIQDGGQASAELNTFLQSHKVLSVDRRWVEQGSASFWCFCVDYLPHASGGSPAGAGRPGFPRGKVDYREVLKPEEFAVFVKLRDLRKEIAQAEAVPVYTIFNNEQLARMVQGKVATKAALEKIAGVGDARIEKYGSRFLTLLGQTWGSGDEANGPAV
jgi:superfamily II DNA helicase RecQ